MSCPLRFLTCHFFIFTSFLWFCFFLLYVLFVQQGEDYHEQHFVRVFNFEYVPDTYEQCNIQGGA